jgi:hypothetical protein
MDFPEMLSNIYELAYSTPGFMKYISTYPDLSVVVGSEAMQRELQNVLQLKSKDQLF